jgi:hypothetical protein
MRGRSRSLTPDKELPEGLTYGAGFIAPEEERGLLDRIAALEFRSVEMRGQVARRTVIPATKELRYSITFRTLKRA